MRYIVTLLIILVAMTIVTAASIASGLDWWYTLHARSSPLAITHVGIYIGFLLPLLVPPTLYLVGLLLRNRPTQRLGLLIGLSAAMGWLASSTLKAFTGRAYPPMSLQSLQYASDTSSVFHFGLLKSGIFWGWPSSHTTVAISIATAVYFSTDNYLIRAGAILFAAIVALGASLSIHWLSDVLAGVMLGVFVGWCVAKYFNSGKGSSYSRK